MLAGPNGALFVRAYFCAGRLSLAYSVLVHLARVTMLSELSGSLAHELNQPLSAILSNAQAGLRFLARKVIQELRPLLKRGEMWLDRLAK